MPKRLQVLVIDGDATERMAIRGYLSPCQPIVEIAEAETGAAGIALLKARHFDCVFVDEGLPDMEGMALLQMFYDISSDQMPAPFVMLITQDREAIAAEALRWGAHDYIVKNHPMAPALVTSLTKAREVFGLKQARRSAEDKLRQAQKMDAVGQLTSGVAHDFNNLLTIILGNTRLMRRRLREIPAAQAAAIAPKVDAVEGAAQRGADLVRHLMVFSRQQELRNEEIDVAAALRGAASLLERTLGARIALVLNLDEYLATVRADPALLENAILNIAQNARDAMPAGGTLALSVSTAVFQGTQHVMITLTDTGAGMPEHVRERVFEPFYTTKPAGEGSGLGLAMVYGFIRQSGGHIEIDSEIGQGTTFRIYLPAYKTTATREAQNAR